MNVELLALEETYRKAISRLFNVIEQKSLKGGLAAYERAVLAEVTQILSGLNRDAAKWVADFVPDIYQVGIEDAKRELKKVVDIIGELTQLDREAIRVLVRNTALELVESNQAVGRQVRDVFRDVQLEQSTLSLATGQGAQGAKRAILKSLVEKGISHFKDSSGRVTDIQGYADMVGRSVVREARHRGMLNTLTQNGYDLVEIIKNNTSCPICSAYEGRVYSVSGNDKRYPPLFGTAFGIYANIHPNCRHVLAPFIEALKDPDEIKEAKRVSNLSFNVDRRSESQRKAYENGQALKRRAREEKILYERYRLALGDKVPKTLASFTSIKQKDGEAWQELKRLYRQVRPD
jgi:hypothetical protein